MKHTHKFVLNLIRNAQFALGVLLPILGLFALPAQARELKISTIQVAPFGLLDAEGKPTGIMYEIGNRIAEMAGFSYTY